MNLPAELYTWGFWEEVVQWGLICYLLFRRPRYRSYQIAPPKADKGSVTVRKEHWETPL